jgi:hypothetical protein
MAVSLEITDGNPEWYLSPDIWVVDDPSSPSQADQVNSPIAGRDYFLVAKVRNTGTTPVSDATVNFYWANPSIGVTRTTAHPIGTSNVTLGSSNDEQEVLCLTPWRPEFENGGHECLIAEAFHITDPLPVAPDFNVPTNLSILLAINGAFHFLFEVHNGERNGREFTINVNTLDINKHRNLIPEKYKGLKEGKLKKAVFTSSVCAPKIDDLKHDIHENVKVGGFSKLKKSLTGQIQGELVMLSINQSVGKVSTGGLVLLIINC